MRAIRINPENVWSDDDFPFSQAVVEPEGRRVHLTGQVAWNQKGEVIGSGDAKIQTECAIDNITKILSKLGGTIADIVSLTMYYVRDEDLEAIQSVRMRRFDKATGPAVPTAPAGLRAGARAGSSRARPLRPECAPAR